MTDHSEMEFTPLIIENSPIEFLVVGPHGGRDKVIVRSANAGLDLLGLAVESSTEHMYSAMSSSIMRLFIEGPRQLNVVESYPIDDLNPRSDGRQSTMRFAWVGNCSPIRQGRIQEYFNRSLSDLRNALRDSNLAEVEWSIAPVVLQCSTASEHRIRSRRFFYIALAMYGIAALVSLVYLVLRSVLKF